MPYRTKLRPRPSAGDQAEWNLLAKPKNGRLTESQFRQLLQCSQDDMKTLAGDVKEWAEGKRGAGEHNFIHSFNHRGDTKEWDSVKQQLGAWLTCHATWGSADRFGVLTSSTVSDAEREALRHAIRFIANVALRSEFTKRVMLVKSSYDDPVLSQVTGTNIQLRAESISENNPTCATERFDCIRRRSVVLVHPAEQIPLYRFPFHTVAKSGATANLAAELRASEISWDSFLDTVRTALSRKYPGITSFAIGTGRHHGEIQSAESFAFVLHDYMNGRYQDKMGNLLLYPWGVNSPRKLDF